MIKRASFLTISVAVITAYTILYLWQPGGQRPLTIIANMLTALSALVAAVCTLQTATTFEQSEPQRRVWLVFGSGLVLWTIAEFIWAYYEIILKQQPPYPSIADLPWAIAYAPLFLGLLFQYRALGVQVEPRRRNIALLIYALALIAILVLVLWPILSTPGESLIVQFLNVLYPVGDLIIAFIATQSLLVLAGGLLGRPWRYIALGMLMFTLADLAYIYADWNDIYATGSNWISGLSDIVYVASYLVTATGAYHQATLTLPDLSED